jgi:hypothetical protein
MRTFATDTNNDLTLGSDGNISIIEDIDATAAVCKNVVQTRLGEMILNADVGMPYDSLVWVGTPNIGQIKAAITQLLLGVNGVESIETLTVVVENNEMRYNATIKTTYGVTTIGV